MVLNYSGADRKRVGVVLKVNGLSTWAADAAESKDCRKWLMDKGNKYTFRGFTMDKDTELPFKVLSDEASASKAAEFGAKAGLITIDVFTQGDGNDERKISLRGLSPRAKKSRSLKDLQSRLLKAARLKMGARGIIDKDDTPIKPGTIKEEEFPNAVLLGSVTIRYYEGKSGGSTQLEVTE
jgi:hypothetical protein